MMRFTTIMMIFGLCFQGTLTQKGHHQLRSTQDPLNAFVFSNASPGTVVQRVFTTPQTIDGVKIQPNYKISVPNKFFDIHRTNGDILVKSNLRTASFKGDHWMATFTVEVALEDDHINGTSVLAKIRIQKETDCANNVEDLCFNMAGKEARVFVVTENEHSPAVLTSNLASASVKTSCSTLRLSYRINSSNPVVYFHSPLTPANEAVLYAQPELDRENVTKLDFSIECSVNETKTGYSSVLEMKAILKIEDIGDSLPELRNPALKVIDVYLKNNGLKENHELPFPEQIILADNDSPSRNEFEITMKPIGSVDVTKLFRIEHSTFKYNTGTVLKIGPVPIASTKITESSSFQLVVKDLKLRSSNNSVTIEVRMHPGFPPTDITTQIPLPVSTSLDVSVLSFNISRLSCNFRRIGNPFEAMLKRKELFTQDPDFTIVPDQERSSHPFQVTPREGILYVAKTNRLHRSKLDHFVLEIEWKSGGVKNMTLVNIHVEDTEKNIQTRCTTNKEFCAEKRNLSECQSLQNAFGTEGGCQWRLAEQGGTFSQKYGTCSTDLKTCPDGRCDELEKGNWALCPQDCTESVIGTGNLGIEDRGIKTAVGVCSCDQTRSCSCAPEHDLPTDDAKNSTPPAMPSTSGPTPLFTSESLALDQVSEEEFSDNICSSTCLAFVAVSVITLIIVISGTVATIITRHKTLRKNKTRRLGSTLSLSAVPSDYVDERERILPNDQATSDIALQQFGCEVVIEPKWMIPKGYLVMEKTLGEGEFGKVIRAKALNVSGSQSQGLTTVAVKMAKMDGGGESDTAVHDLWSEFSLLKEVDHLHVIRLVGACLTNNELLLVLEYAEHGSLRSYLRRSRKIESEIDNSGDDDNIRPEVTPRDILSFAWQISKGMAYLSDMKLVHRDLAARNILVATGNIAKISDFGLTRDVYEEDTYLKRSKGRVPVKWMAPESLADQLYTSKSDVWSFGILLWELTTLGSTPYPGMRPEKLYRILKSGYRMERPDYCSQELYSIMLHCWEDSPNDRPSFQELVSVFDRMLAAGAEYLDLTSLLVNNPGYFGGFESDEQEENEHTASTTESLKSPRSTEGQSCAETDIVYLIPKANETCKSSNEDPQSVKVV